MNAPKLQKVTAKISVRYKGAIRFHNVDHTPFTIGRLEENDLSFDDPQLSRRHAEIVIRDGDYYLVDRQSTHGSLVNGAKVTEHRLSRNDRVQFGASPIEIIFDPASVLQPIDTHTSLFGFGRPEAAGQSPLVELEGLSLFLDAARKLNSSRVVDDVAVTLLDATLRLTKASRGFVFRVDEAGELQLVTGRDTKGRVLDDASGISQSILKDAMHSSSKFLVTDTSRLSDLDHRASIVAHDLRSVICIPLFRGSWARKGDATDKIAKKEVQGLLYLDSNFVTGALNKTSEDVLTSIATEASALLDNARLMEAEQVAVLQKRELEIASNIQQQLMEVKLPESSFASIEARSLACKSVGGDFYDVVQTPKGIAVVLVDVSGKGVSSALLASTLQGIICSQLESGIPLPKIASWIDRFIEKKRVGGKYATMILAQLEPSGKLEYLNCGHVHAALLSAGDARLLEAQNRPVGLLSGGEYVSDTLQLSPGDRFVLVSDGLTEATNAADDDFGLERFAGSLQKAPSIDALFGALFDFVEGKPLDDDCTAISTTFVG